MKEIRIWKFGEQELDIKTTLTGGFSINECE